MEFHSFGKRITWEDSFQNQHYSKETYTWCYRDYTPSMLSFKSYESLFRHLPLVQDLLVDLTHEESTAAGLE